MTSVNSITSKMSILPKSQNSNFQNPIFDQNIMELEYEKQALKKKIKILREENEMYERREKKQRIEINESNKIKNKEEIMGKKVYQN